MNSHSGGSFFEISSNNPIAFDISDCNFEGNYGSSPFSLYHYHNY